MPVSFNVLDDGWIPAVTPEGSTALLGIRQLLRDAPGKYLDEIPLPVTDVEEEVGEE